MDTHEGLNSKQLEAVAHVEGPLLIIAGAGSGKTRVVTHRILNLLQMGVPATEILAVTFTNKAAEEMRTRIQRHSNLYILAATFHSLCAQILREAIGVLDYTQNFTIFDEEDSEKVLKECFQEKELKDEKGLFKTIRSAISSAKNQLQEPEDLLKDDPVLAELYGKYQAKLKRYNAVDFDDLLFLTVKIFKTFPEVLEHYQKKWSFILIDEYQDTNHAQYVLVKNLAGRTHNVFAVGDPDQSIYSWRGANIQNILNFEKDFPGAKVITLEENYRSKNTILKAANGLIQNNEARHEKKLWSQRGEGEKVGVYFSDNDHEEIAFVVDKLKKHHKMDQVPLSETVIFYRTHSQSRLIEDSLIREKIPYMIIGGISFYARREIKDILGFLRMLLDTPDFLSFARTINIPRRGFGESTTAKLRMLSFERNCDIFTLCQEIVENRISFKLSEKQYAGLKNYVHILSALRNKKENPVSEIITLVIEQTGYLDYLKEDPETAQERRENIQELISKAFEWEDEVDDPTLVSFLQELALKTNQDKKDPYQDSVKLMTLHHGKGLEFRQVFLVGMEEELLPHMNSLGNFEALEEERRLCYVGMTRAKDFLYLSSSAKRLLWGTVRMMRPSRFLAEIPSECVRILNRDPEVRETPNSFSTGDAVYHQDFGKGIVQKTYSTSFGTTYDVLFREGNLLRSLVAKFAKLTAANPDF